MRRKETEVIKKRRPLLEENLERIKQTLIAKYKPEKIIVFGSLATGDIREWSAIDLVVIKKIRASFFRRLEEISLLCDYNVGVDFLVYTPEEFEEMKRQSFFIKTEVSPKGKVIYERKRK